MKNIIIGNGFLGNIFKEFYPDYQILNRNDNISEPVSGCIVCAPTGNRRNVEKNPNKDLDDVDNILNLLNSLKPVHTTLVSTIDTKILSKSSYSRNRKILETSFDYEMILRLPTLIHRRIQKNFLHDLKRQIFLDFHSLDSSLQWYDLENLKKDLTAIKKLNKKDYNLVSEPIYNHEIINLFFRDFDKTVFSKQNKCHYDISNSGKYHCSKQQIFSSMKKYLHDGGIKVTI